jgi:hypothetical protein
MANIQIAELAQVENQFDELSDLELESTIGGKTRWWKYIPPITFSYRF